MQFDNKEQPLFLSPQWTQERKKNNTHTHTYEKNGNTCPTHLPPHCNAPHPDRKPILVCIPLNYLKINFFNLKSIFWKAEQLKDKERQGNRDLPLTASFPKYLQQLWMSQAKAEPRTPSRSSHEWQGSNTSAYKNICAFLLFLSQWREAGLGLER